MFIAALFLRHGSNLNVDWWINIEYHSAIKGRNSPFVTLWVNLKTLCKMIQTEKHKYCMISLIDESKNVELRETVDWQFLEPRRWERKGEISGERLQAYKLNKF